MKTLKSLIVLGIAASLLFVQAANAQNNQGGSSVPPASSASNLGSPASGSPYGQRRHKHKHRKGQGGGRGMGKARKLQKFDANHDGVLEPDEKAAARAAREQRRQRRMNRGQPH